MRTAPSDMSMFVNGDDAALRALLVIAAGESMTDDLAERLLVDDGRSARWARGFVQAIHGCNFVVERNSEWHLVPPARQHLVELLLSDGDLSRGVHAWLYRLATDPSQLDFGGELPRYIESGTAAAYHGVFVDAPAALERYGAIAEQPRGGQQWLASRLAGEQVALGVIPADSIEVLFLRGMVMYREGRIRDAEPVLRTVSEAHEIRREVAIASHLVGRIDGERPRDRARGEALLRRSLAMLRELGDVFGQAQVLNSLGQVVAKDPKRAVEAEELLRESVSLGDEIGNSAHRAQALLSLGQLLGHDPQRRDEAETMLRHSLELSLGDRQSERLILHSLGQLLGRDPARVGEAEDMLRKSIELQVEVGDEFGQAQVLHSLGQLLGRDPRRLADAQSLLEESLKRGESLGKANHQAQVLYSMARLAGTPRDRAEELLRRSLNLNLEMGNEGGVRIVRAELRRKGLKA